MPNPLTRAQQRENRAFLKLLRRTGNAAEAARVLGFVRSRFLNRRWKYPAFAAEWDAALALAQAAFHEAREAGTDGPYVPGEPCIRRSKTGHLQLRRYRPGMIDHAGRQRFLAALSATANARLSAAAAGFMPSTLYHERYRNPAFAREWLMALQMGYDRLELALLEAADPASFTDDDWRRNDPPPVPPLTANQALQLLYLHQKEARLGGEHPFLQGRLNPGETLQAQSMRLGLMYQQGQQRKRDKLRIAEAERLARGEPTRFEWNPGELPDLSQVTGWSQASGKPPTDETRALFGGRRMNEIQKLKRKG